MQIGNSYVYFLSERKNIQRFGCNKKTKKKNKN